MKKKLAIAAVWILIWAAAAWLIGNDILFAGPAATVRALIELVRTGSFWLSVLNSLAMIALGFLIGTALGLVLAPLSYRFRTFGDFLSPAVSFLKAAPVVSFIIIVLIWAGSRAASMIISAVVVFPIIYISVLGGLKSADPAMKEMAYVMRMPLKNRARFIYWPAVRPGLSSALSLACGMSWKSGVAAEVIGQPLSTIGNGMYRAKIYLDTAQLFAWTIVTIALSWLFEKAVSAAVSGKRRGRRRNADS
ncbi:MAG: ABC transporter permease [Oscillospiraceae bacterium]